MRIGVAKEIKNNEFRVGLTPAGAHALIEAGHEVMVEKSAGEGSFIPDSEYEAVGAKIVADRKKLFDDAEMIIKVKEPIAEEYDLFHEGQILFTYLHLAAEPELTASLLKNKVVGIAYETVVGRDGRSLPLLQPMSEVAGRMSIQVAARFLEKIHGGKGKLMGGVAGVLPAKVCIVGGGTVGTNAAKMAVGMGAEVTIIDNNLNRLRELDDIFGARVHTLASNPLNIAQAVKESDVVIGSVLIPGAKTPQLVTTEMVKQMSPGSVIVDVAIDQGGAVQSVDGPTTHEDPVRIKYDVVHYSVANMPGAVANTSTYALTNATLPYALAIANKGWQKAIADDAGLAEGVNTLDGHCTFRGVAEALQLEYKPVSELI
ncbi:MAG: alanine dehydrogenase [Veillonellaceae bacterium]|nr:alanine dehydrogenase [Veillonellaceae bacterium]